MTSKNGKEFQKRATVDGYDYSVTMPLNSWDMNFHFIDDSGADYLVDLQDVIDWKHEKGRKGNGANLDDAIAYAQDMVRNLGTQFYWMVR